jgi:hypothetical protein
MKKDSVEGFYSKAWANEQLRFAIAVLQGKIESPILDPYGFAWKRRLQTVLIVKEALIEHGFTWQASRIDNWIHRLQPRKADLEREERRAH